MKQVDMSTFLSNNDVLLRCGHRYLLFDQDGFFKQQISFVDQDDTKGEEETDMVKEYNNWQILLQKINEKSKDLDFIQQGQIEQGLQDDGDSANEFEYAQEFSQHNKMELLQFSPDNKKFLFLNRLSLRMKVYELKLIEVYQGEKKIEQLFFSKLFTLDSKNSELLKESKKFMHGENKFKFRDYLEKCLSINVENDGSVSMMLISQPDRNDDENMHSVFFEVVISMFKVELVNKRYKILTHNVKEQYYKPSNEEIQKCHFYEQEYLENRISENEMMQQRFQSHLKDRTEIDIIETYQQYLQNRQRRLIHGTNQNGLIILWQGSWFQWTKIDFIEGGQAKLRKELYPIKVSFNKNSEILRVDHKTINDEIDSDITGQKVSREIDMIQILLKIHSIDQYDNRYIILTWDMIHDQQISILEVQDDQNLMLEFNLMKGINEKLNYFQDKHAIIDLDNTIPIQVVREKQSQQRNQMNIQRLYLKFDHQRKVFLDNSRYLQIIRPQCLVFSYSYLNMVLWRDIIHKKDKLSLFRQVVSLKDFMVDFDGQSLFHVYVKKSDVIQYIHDLYMDKKRAGKLTSEEAILPLFILNNDVHNYTALFRCIQYENYKSFELLVSMLTDISNIFISKSLIRSLPVMLKNESDAVLRYFDHNFYSPIEYQDPQMLQWPDDIDESEIEFPSNTTLLNTDEILQMLQNRSLSQKKEIHQQIAEKENGNGCFEDEETKLQAQLKGLEENLQQFESIQSANNEIRGKIRDFRLYENVRDDSLTGQLKGNNKIGYGSKNKRVIIQVIDFDFLFFNENSLQMIGILASESLNVRALTRASIKSFVRLMWRKYQPTIIWKLFIPYVIYTLLFVDLCGDTLPDYWSKIQIRDQAAAEGVYDTNLEPSKIFLLCQVFICFAILAYNGSFEVIQFFEIGITNYFSSGWNVIDSTQMILNTFILINAFATIQFQIHFIDKQIVILTAAYSTCLMWFKMFYWMRLFAATAKYVSLIMQTVSDITYFVVMVVIILITFGSFFFIIDVNAQTQNLGYIPDYSMGRLTNALIQTYFILLGEFSYDIFSTGPNISSCWLMFISATFFNCVVFMNMLVAIMGQTFNEVNDAAEEQGLRQQISLIEDYKTLVNHENTWKNVRYIIKVQVLKQTEDNQETVLNQQQQQFVNIEKLLNNLKNQIDEIKEYITKIV